jgi:23S rRNA pseudouridine2605 synthase
MAEERLQKILASVGIASRRKAEEIILEGRVTVNGKVVTELGTKADLETDYIKVDGRLLREPEKHVYIALYKPDSVVTTASDPQGRATVLDLLPGVKARVFPVGRLDYHSEGLLILTNDGDFANAITSAKSHVPKTYYVKTKGVLTPESEEKFRTGIPLGGKRTAPAGLRLIRKGDNPWYEVRLIEGRNQQIRLMFRHLGHLVEKLRRVKIGPLELGKLKPGEFRYLAPAEVLALSGAVHEPASTSPGTSLERPEKRSSVANRRATKRKPGIARKPGSAKRAAAGEAGRPPKLPRAAGKTRPPQKPRKKDK